MVRHIRGFRNLGEHRRKLGSFQRSLEVSGHPEVSEEVSDLHGHIQLRNRLDDVRVLHS